MNFESRVVGVCPCETGGCDNVVIHSDRWSTLLLLAVCLGKCSRHSLTPMGHDTRILPDFSPSELWLLFRTFSLFTNMFTVITKLPTGVMSCCFVCLLSKKCLLNLLARLDIGGWVGEAVLLLTDGWAYDEWRGAMHGWQVR